MKRAWRAQSTRLPREIYTAPCPSAAPKSGVPIRNSCCAGCIESDADERDTPVTVA